MNYSKLAFTEAIKRLQQKHGSRASYEKMEKFAHADGLSARERMLIEERDSFFAASLGENGYPYIQHRGGPKGFLKVLSPTLLGFLDFSGNKQYITTGNIQTNNKVSLILVDYPSQARLKIYAQAQIVSLGEIPELEAKLYLPGYRYKPERIILYHVRAFDWNCPQHITPRYTLEELQQVIRITEE